ncbi:hypothetical protein D3C81_1539900 [compost metagenome]
MLKEPFVLRCNEGLLEQLRNLVGFDGLAFVDGQFAHQYPGAVIHLRRFINRQLVLVLQEDFLTADRNVHIACNCAKCRKSNRKK